MIEYNFEITILSYINIEDEFVNYTWEENSLEFLNSKNIKYKLLNINDNQKKNNHEIKKLIFNNDIIRISYPPENWKLEDIFLDTNLFENKN